VDTKTAIKIGLVAGLVSALFPSVPTMVFGSKTWGSDYTNFLKWYVPLGMLVIVAVMVM